MTIFFDIDDTLVDSNSAHGTAIGQISDHYHLTNDLPEKLVSVWLHITDSYLRSYFEGQVSLDQQRAYRLMDLWKYYGKDLSEQEASAIYTQYHGYFISSCRAFDDALPTLKALSELTDMKLGIISNGISVDQTEKLILNGLIAFFETIVVSSEVGYSKPAKEIFRIALEQAQSTPADSLYIGNDFMIDYEGALAAGMKAIWLNRQQTLVNQDDDSVLRISSLIELMDIKKIM